jgi:hypothetical protein
MKVHTATLAGGDHNADRVFVTDHAVILLDGASAFAPVDVDPGDYAATLGQTIADQLDTDPNRNLPAVVAAAIAHTTAVLRLGAGTAPSSTVTILRTRAQTADLYVLGDSPIHYGTGPPGERLADERLSALPTPQRERYQTALAGGVGYTDQHRATLAELQHAQRQHRNRTGGYWIAETDPTAAHHAVTATIPAEDIAWAVLATDGAADAIDHHDRPTWFEIAQHDTDELSALLGRLHQWETTADPDGRLLPRAKRHDDKTLAAIPNLW